MVTTGDKRSDLPLNAAVNFDDHVDGAVGLVLRESNSVVGRDGYGVAVDKGRPNVDVLVALIDRRYNGVVGDLLAVVGGVDVQLVVVDSDLGVGVTGVNGDLEGGGDDVRRRDGEVEDGGVLEDETGFFGLKDGPCYQENHQDDEAEDEKSGAAPPDNLSILALVVAAHFF